MSKLETLKFRKTWLIIGWLLVLMVCYLSLTPESPLPEIDIAFIDKLGHLLAYAILMGWFAQLYEKFQQRILFTLFFICMGVVLEYLQSLGEARLFEYADMIANTAGVFFAWAVSRGAMEKIFWLFEQKVLRV